MLLGDKGKYLGIVSGIALASLLMIQQPSILLTILSQTYSLITDISLPDIWVMPSKIAGFSTWYWSAIPGVSWPLFDAGKARAAVEKKKALYDEALAGYKATFHTALEDVENALAAYYAEREREHRLVLSVNAYQEALDLANIRYSKGLTTFLTVLVDQATLFSAQTNLSKSRANLRTDIVSLYKALGGGWQVEAAAAPTTAAAAPAGPSQPETTAPLVE